MSPHPQTGPNPEILTALVEHSSDAIVLLDQTGTVLYASPSTTRLLGYPLDEVLGENAFERVHPEDLSRMKGIFERRLREPGVPIRNEFRYRHHDGAWRHIESVGVNRLDDPAVRGIVVNYRDVSERRLAEDALRSGEARYRYLIEHASDIIYFCDTLGRFVFCNPTAVRLMKYTEEELIGRHFLSLIRPDYREEAGRLYARQITERIPATYFEFPAIAKDGTEVWFGQNVQLVIEGHQLGGVQAIARDITQRLALEEQLRQSQKMEAIGRLAGGVAHDFNNLLTAILGSSELLTMQLDPGDPKWAEANAILRAAERGASLTRRLLAFSRPQSSPSTVLEIGALVRNMDPMLQRLVLDQIETRIVTGPEPVYVESDEGLIGQVLMNLVMNARDAMPSGGTVTIDVGITDLDETSAHLAGLATGRYARLSVSDVGEGIDAETQIHLFEPFFTTKDPSKGTGLGLSIVYSIVKGNDGGIGVDSERGHGATFHIYLPLAEPPQ